MNYLASKYKEHFPDKEKDKEEKMNYLASKYKEHFPDKEKDKDEDKAVEE
jgi:hypothetical protein